MADFKRIALVFVVGLLLSLFFGFLVDAVYPAPSYDDYCTPDSRPVYDKFAYPEMINTSSCPKISYNDPVYSSCTYDIGDVSYKIDSNGCRVDPYCDSCRVDLQGASESYSRNLFFIFIPLSIVLIIVGFLLSLESIGSGFVLGGIFLVIYATIRIFGDLSKIMRVILLGIELVIVLWVGYKKIEKPHIKKK